MCSPCVPACDFPSIGNLIRINGVAIPFLAVSHAIVTFVLPYFLYTMSMKDIPAGVAPAMGIMEPLAATILSIMLLGEKLSLFSLTGIILILGAAVILSRNDE